MAIDGVDWAPISHHRLWAVGPPSGATIVVPGQHRDLAWKDQYLPILVGADRSCHRKCEKGGLVVWMVWQLVDKTEKGQH